MREVSNSSSQLPADYPLWKDGFDVMIGNPPYKILTKNNTESDLLDKYLSDYKSIRKSNSKNIYTLFIENAIVRNVSSHGVLSFIVPEGLYQTRSYADYMGFRSPK